MCLSMIDSVHKTLKLKESLPKWFPVQKLICRNDEPLFGGERLTRGRTHKAANKPSTRSFISYEPGFHAFLDEGEAEKALKAAECCWDKDSVLRKFWAKPGWITKNGLSNSNFAYAKTVVLKKIHRK